MELIRSFISNAPGNCIRLNAEVVYDDGYKELYWFELPAERKSDINLSGNLWLVCLLPIAMKRNESLTIKLPVDEVLFKNVVQWMKVFSSWYPQMHTIALNISEFISEKLHSEDKTLAFFSGGVDSYFTLLSHEQAGNLKIDELIYVGGFDIPLKNIKEHSALANVLSGAADKLHKKFIYIKTNIRETRFSQADWGQHSHGCALAAVALLLEKKFSTALIASTGGYSDLSYWGSHVATDHFLSTQNLKFINDGAEFNLIQKIDFIKNSDIVHATLHVCWKNGSDTNCSRCMKCYRTMLMFDVFNALSNCKTFDLKWYTEDRLEKMYIDKEYDEYYMALITKYAQLNQRKDIVKLVRKCLKRSKRLQAILPICQNIENFLKDKRFIWRYAPWPKKIILANSIY